MASKWQRKKFLINYKAQLNVIWKVGLFFMVFVCVLVTVFYTHYAAVTSPENLKDLSFSDQAVAKEVLYQPMGQIAFYYGVLTAVFLVLLVCYLVILTHRMTGPIFKLNKILKEAIETERWPEPFRFRKNDAFPELADNLNAFIETMKKKR